MRMCDVCVLFCVKSAPACDTLAVVIVVAAINGLLAALVGGVAYRQCQQNRQTEPCQPRSGTQTDTKAACTLTRTFAGAWLCVW